MSLKPSRCFLVGIIWQNCFLFQQEKTWLQNETIWNQSIKKSLNQILSNARQNNHWNERLELKLILTSSVNSTKSSLLLKANKQVTLKVSNICFFIVQKCCLLSKQKNLPGEMKYRTPINQSWPFSVENNKPAVEQLTQLVKVHTWNKLKTKVQTKFMLHAIVSFP